MQALHIAASGMLAQQHRTEVVSNNLANMNTTGFQRSKTEFTDLLYSEFRRPVSAAVAARRTVPAGVSSGLGVKTASVYRVHEQGSLKQTGNTFDVAVRGEGFFQILLPQGGTAYTRNGTFQLDDTGQLVTHDGFTVALGAVVPPDAVDVTINGSGEVLVTLAGDEEPANIGLIQLATFPNPGGLQAEGDSFFIETTESGPATANNPGIGGAGTLQQGFIESSNVNPIEELALLIKAQRAYDMNAKMISAVDQMMATR
ncbi:MAG: flagellar basal-body rod protein FlgG [Rhodospirillales bacterium]